MSSTEFVAKGGPCGRKCKSRYILASLGSVGMGIIYGLKVGLHACITFMVNATALNDTGHKSAKSDCPGVAAHNHTHDPSKDGPFLWDSSIQGLILSSYFWGYLVAELPGGRLAEMFSAKWVMFFAVAINIVCVFLSPLFARAHYAVLIFSRVLQGIGGGVTFPAMHVLLAHWAPPGERSVMSNIVYAGTALGTVLFMLLSGVIAGSLSWEAVFYIEAGIASPWLICWKPPPVPWKAAMTSRPFLAILVAHTCGNWGWYMVLVELPIYMKSVLHFDMGKNAFLTALPFLTMYVFSLILSALLDHLRGKKTISTTTARKTATLLSCLCPIVCFTALCFIKCDRNLAIAIMTIAITFIGGMYSGYLANHIDLAPNFAGTLMAVTNTVATIPGITVPIAVGELTKRDPSIDSWRIIFGITIGLYIIQSLVYGFCASGELQPWNEGAVAAVPAAD